MVSPMRTIGACVHLIRGVFRLGGTALAAENLLHRKQLARYRERQVRSRWASDPLRLALVLLARCFPWREALTIVQSSTLLRWLRSAKISAQSRR